MASETKQITIRELWIQMRGIENAFRFYSDALNGVAYSSPKSYDYPVPIDEPTYTALTAPYEIDCIDPPWCRTTPRKVAKNFGKLEERIDAMAIVLRALLDTLPGDKPIDFYMSEVPGTSWSGQPSPGRN